MHAIPDAAAVYLYVALPGCLLCYVACLDRRDFLQFYFYFFAEFFSVSVVGCSGNVNKKSHPYPEYTHQRTNLAQVVWTLAMLYTESGTPKRIGHTPEQPNRFRVCTPPSMLTSTISEHHDIFTASCLPKCSIRHSTRSRKLSLSQYNREYFLFSER